MTVAKKKTTKKKVTKKKIVKKKSVKKKSVKKKSVKKTTKKTGAALKKTADELLNSKGTAINLPDNYVFGRPSEYSDAYPEKVYLACVSGECLTLASICCLLDICRDTLYDWKEKHPTFSYAIKKGTEYRKRNMEEKGMLGMNQGKSFNAIPWLFLTKNMFPDEYKERQEVEVGNKGDETFKFAFDLNDKPEG